MKILRRIIKKHSIMVILFLLMCIFGIMWLISDNPGSIGDFGLNAFTELLGIVITVLIVEQIIEKQHKEKMMPINAAAHREIQLFVSNVISFWASVYHNSVPGDNPDDIEILFSKEKFDLMLWHLDMESFPPVLPKNNWFNHIHSEGNKLRKLGERPLQSYSSSLEPRIFKYLHRLVRDGYLINGMQQIQITRNLDIQQGIPRPTALGCYFIEPFDEDYEAIIELSKWLNKSKKEFEGSDFTLYEVQLNYVNPKKDVPESMLTKDKLTHQNHVFSYWQDSKIKEGR